MIREIRRMLGVGRGMPSGDLANPLQHPPYKMTGHTLKSWLISSTVLQGVKTAV